MDKSDAYLPKCAEESGRRGAKEHQDADGVNRCAETRCLQFELTQLCRHPHLPEPTSCPTRAHTRACAHVRIVFGHKCLYACVYILLHADQCLRDGNLQVFGGRQFLETVIKEDILISVQKVGLLLLVAR